MASLNSQQAGRDAESFDNDRHDGVYSPGGSRAHWFPVEPRSVEPLAPDMQAALDKAMASCEAAFGKWDRATGRYIPHPKAPMECAA